MSYWNQLDSILKERANRRNTIQLHLYVHDGNKMFCVPAEVTKEFAELDPQTANDYIKTMTKIAFKELSK